MKEVLTIRIPTNLKENYKTVCEESLNSTMTQNITSHIKNTVAQESNNLIEQQQHMNQIRNFNTAPVR